MKAAILYWTKSGNTEKVALAIKECIQSIGVEVEYLRVDEAKDLDFFDYDLICLGFPSYRWQPPKPVDNFLVGDFTKAHMRTKKGVTIEIGLDGDNFTKNFKTIRAEWRGVVYVKNNDRTAFVNGVISTSAAALETT